MTRFLPACLGLVLCLAVSYALAQTNNQGQTTQGQTTQGQTITPGAPLQSLRPGQSPCGASSQSVRVCNDDFRSCNSICTAETIDPGFDVAGCDLRCCNQFKACLSIRGCATLTLDCF